MRVVWIRWVVFGIVILVVTLGAPAHDACASVSIAVTFDALVHDSSAVVLATAAEQRSVWENGRIYTYTRIHVDSAFAGELQPKEEAWVRTMGGIVGKTGQVVEGEAGFTLGRPSLVFLRHPRMGPYVVTARAQGQFTLYVDAESAVRVQKSDALGALFAPKGPNTIPLASEVLEARAMSDAAQAITAAWTRLHSP
jgi:hypothetical protein